MEIADARSRLRDQNSMLEEFENISKQTAAALAASRETRRQMVRSVLASALFESKAMGSKAPLTELIDDMSRLASHAKARYDNEIEFNPPRSPIPPPPLHSPVDLNGLYGFEPGDFEEYAE